MRPTLSPLVRKIALTLAILLLAFAAGLFYVNKILLPVQVKALAVEAAEKALGRKVTLETLQYDPWHGLVITGIFVGEKNDPSRPFLQARSVSLQVLLPALLQKKVIVTALRIKAPRVALTRLEQARWNFSDLLPAATGPAAPAPGMDIVISGFSVEDGAVDISDTSAGSPFQETVNIPAVQGSFSLTGAFRVAGQLLFPATQGAIDFDARIALAGKDYKGSVKAKNIVPGRYLRFSPVALPLEARALTIASADITASLQGRDISLSGDLDLPGLDITLPDGTMLQGDINLSRVAAALKMNDISLIGSLAGNKLRVQLSSGPRMTLNTLRVPDAQATLKNGELKAAGNLNAKEFSITLNTGEQVNGNLDIVSAQVTQDAKAIRASADIKIMPLALTLGQDRSATADITLSQTTVNMEGAAVQAKADIDVNNAAVALPGITIAASLTAPDTRLNLDTGRLDAGAQLTFRNFTLKSNNMEASGNPHLAAHIVFNPQAATPLAYSGTLRLPDITIAGLPVAGEIKDLNGEIAFATGDAQIKDLNFTVLDTPVHVSGRVTHFEAPVLDIAATCAGMNLAIIEKFIPDIVREHGLAVKGTAAVDIALKGPLASFSVPQKAGVSAKVKLTDVSLASKTMGQRITALNGLVEYAAATLSWKEITASYDGKQWASHGFVQNPDEPFISASIRTSAMNADIQAKKQGDTINIETLTGAYADSSFSAKGSVLAPAGQKPRVNFSGNCRLVLKDLATLLPPEQARQIDALKVAGTLKIAGSVKGDPLQWQDLEAGISINASTLKVMGYEIDDLDIDATQKDGKVDPLTANATIYGGSLTSTTTIALKDKGMPFDTTAKLDNTDLALLKQDTPLKQQQLSGKISSTAQLKGELLNILDLKGTSTVKLADGHLWDLAILSKILTILSSSFQGGDIVITDADATLDIHDRKVWTDDLALRSAAVTLLGNGWIGFDQAIDLTITPRLEMNAGSGAASTLALINPTEGLVNIHVSNTLAAPKIEHDISAPKVIKKTIQNTVGSILKLFE